MPRFVADITCACFGLSRGARAGHGRLRVATLFRRSLPEIGMAGPVMALDVRRRLLWPIIRFVSAVFVCVIDVCAFVSTWFSLALVSR